MHSRQLVVETCRQSLKRGRDLIQDNLRESDAWVIRGLLCIYDYQTADEQASEHTKDHNDVGFNGLDAQILTSFAKQVHKHKRNPQYPTPLSVKQMRICRNKMLKYAGQLARVVRQTAPVEEEAAA